jgi:7-cyano-7-deazaguanine synthase
VTTALLLSGGMDSIALAYWKRPDRCITIDYGQVPAQGEIQAARSVCEVLGLRQEVVRVDCSALGSGDLAGREALSIAPVSEWWPYRNQLLLTIAACHLVDSRVRCLLIGCVRGDSVHRDGSREFVEGISHLLSIQEGEIRVEAPALGMSSVELIRASGIPREVLAWAHSCHVGEFACGSCRGCSKHFTTMKELGIGPY